MRTLVLLLVLAPLVAAISGSYVPGTPGAVWSRGDVEIVRVKVKEMIDIRNWLKSQDGDQFPDGSGTFLDDGTFTTDGSSAIDTTNDWCRDCLWGKKDNDKEQVPQASKLLRLAFHDCVPYVRPDGSVSGGCDGCINWAGMGFGYSGFPDAEPTRDYYPVDKGDNNGLQTTVGGWTEHLS